MKPPMITTAALLLSATLMSAQQPTGQTRTKAESPVENNDTTGSLYDDLDELVVTAKKEVVKSDGAKLTYDMEQDSSSKGQSLLDALRKVPLVTVDGQDNIAIKGNSNFKVYVNGKEEPMLSANASQIFKAMPAESVSKIEVITEPGAKYDAEGTGGILNLITERKQTKEGYTANINLGAGVTGYNAGAYGRMKYSNFTADANVNYFSNSYDPQKNTNIIDVLNPESDSSYLQSTESTQSAKFNYTGANLNMSWEPNEKNLFTLGGNLMSTNIKLEDMVSRTQIFSRSGDLVHKYGQDYSGTMKNFGSGLNASYRHNFNDKGQNITAAYFFNFSKNPVTIDIAGLNILDYPYISPWQRSTTKEYGREHTATLDYTLPLLDGKHTIETGVKEIFRRNGSESSQYDGTSPEDAILDPHNYVHARQIQDVYAVYGMYTGVFGKVTASAGVRYERTHMGMDFLNGYMDNFRTNLNDVTPNAAVTYMFSPTNNLRLAYQMRISRPTMNQLNPYELRLTETETRRGNPNLDSERYNSITLTYSNFGRILGGNISLEAYQSNNTIEEFYTYITDANGIDVNMETYGNLGKMQSLRLNGFLNWNITRKMSVSVNGQIDYTHLHSPSLGLSNHGWNGNYGLRWGYTGPWDVKYSAYGGQSTGNIQLQRRFKGYYYYGLSIAKSFLKNDALIVTLNANNFLAKHTIFHWDSDVDGRHMSGTSRNRNWNVGIAVSWNFGHLDDKVKSTGAVMQNDDKKASSSGNNQGGGIGI